jgi:hypothetical protein
MPHRPPAASSDQSGPTGTQVLPPAAMPAAERTAAPAARPSSTDGRRLGLIAVVVGLLAVAAFAAVSALGDDGSPSAAPDEVAETAPPPPGGQPLTGLVPSSFDPFGGDGENDDEVGFLVDGDPTTAWTTVGYNSAQFGNLKPGVGVVVDLGEAVQVGEVRLLGMAEGQSVEIRSAPAAPVDLDATPVIATGQDLGSDAALRPGQPTTTRYLVVWLVPDLPPDGGRFRGVIGEVQVLPAG